MQDMLCVDKFLETCIGHYITLFGVSWRNLIHVATFHPEIMPCHESVYAFFDHLSPLPERNSILIVKLIKLHI